MAAIGEGRVESVRTLIALGAEPNARGTSGGSNHGEDVTAIHLAAQSGHREAVATLLELGADPLITDSLHGGTTLGRARIGCTRTVPTYFHDPAMLRSDDRYSEPVPDPPRRHGKHGP